MLSKISFNLTFIFTLVVNYLVSATTIINSTTTKAISDMNPTMFTPKPYVFSIWGLIYVGLIAFMVYANKYKVDSKLLWLFSITNLANIVWIILWQYNLIHLSLLVIILMFVTLLKIMKLNLSIPIGFTKEYISQRLPFEIYGSWITVATIANATISIKRLLLDDSIICIKAPCQTPVLLFGINEYTWALTIGVVAITLSIFMLIKYKILPYPVVIIWALYGIFF